mmetsp:Transcript_19415/g.61768  ORF Transcript_19415/g.61768 Transcript_19415/m.61768 type:complete len:385 (+) Transcript_19415:1815-2969(+)
MCAYDSHGWRDSLHAALAECYGAENAPSFVAPGSSLVRLRLGGRLPLKARRRHRVELLQLLDVQVVALDAREGRHRRVRDELPHDLGPRGVVRQRVVELVGNLAQLGQARASHVGEVVVLVVIADVEGDPVKRTIVRVRLLAGHEGVVLRHEVARHRVQAHAQQGAHEEVQQSPPAEEVDDDRVEDQLDGDVDQLQTRRHARRHIHGPQRVEGRLQDHPDQLHEGTTEHTALPRGGNVPVHVVLALILVVVRVVALEGRKGGHPQRHAGEHAEHAVVERLAEGQVVRDLVHRQRHRVVDRAAQHVGAHEPGPEGEARSDGAHADLQRHREQHLPLEVRARSIELGNLRVLLQDLAAALGVRLPGGRPFKVVGSGTFPSSHVVAR